MQISTNSPVLLVFQLSGNTIIGNYSPAFQSYLSLEEFNRILETLNKAQRYYGPKPLIKWTLFLMPFVCIIMLFLSFELIAPLESTALKESGFPGLVFAILFWVFIGINIWYYFHSKKKSKVGVSKTLVEINEWLYPRGLMLELPFGSNNRSYTIHLKLVPKI